MEIEYDLWTGSLNIVKASLIRSVGQYTRRYKKVKIGITDNPERRTKNHEKSDIKWVKMVVKYQTNSVNFINQMEKILIEHHYEFVENINAGGGGPNGSPPYYLYLLLK